MSTPSTTSITTVDDFTPLTKGDTSTPLTGHFWKWNQAEGRYKPINLTDLTLSMRMKNPDGEVKVCAAEWTKTDAANGEAEYPWDAADVDTADIWTLQVQLLDSNGKPAHTCKRTITIEEPV